MNEISGREITPINYQDRIRRLAASLSAGGIDAYVGTRQGSLHYLVGTFVPWRGAVIVTSSGQAELIYWAMDSERLRQEGWGLEVIEYDVSGPVFVEQLTARLKEKGLARGRIGLDLFIPGSPLSAPGLLLAQEFLDLKRLMGDAELVNGTSFIDELMLIKSSEEVERLRLAARAADVGFAAGLAAIKPGITENGVAGVIECAIRDAGSIWSWSVTGGTEVGSGHRTNFSHGVSQPATNKKIGKNEFVLLDVHPMVHLYLADMCLPIFIGQPDSEQQRLIDCWEETVDYLLYNLKPELGVATICSQALKIFSKHGLAEYGLSRFGHGLGTCARLRPFVSPRSPDILMPGMVFALGTALIRPGVGGLRLEYPVLMTENGAEPLCMTTAQVHRVNG